MDLIAAIILIVLSAVVFLFVGIIIANTINSKRASSQYAQDSYQTPPNDQGTVQNGIEHLFIPKSLPARVSCVVALCSRSSL